MQSQSSQGFHKRAPLSPPHRFHSVLITIMDALANAKATPGDHRTTPAPQPPPCMLPSSMHAPAPFPPIPPQFYHYRREVAGRCKPNAAHYALAAFEKRSAAEGREVQIITQNVDGLHQVGWELCAAAKLEQHHALACAWHQ